ncbi:MAG: enoyl-CoA hydratase/isomerase family protein [Acidobacteriia bacterium]|nr:enoyl-CoA hydratase/isomerase family protein [Terriglobia bacterium]
MSSPTEPLLLRHDRDGVATLTLNRPAQRNALSVALMSALQAELDRLKDDRSVKVVVIAGAGPGFCGGHDLKEMRANPGRQAYEALFSQCSRLMMSIVRLPKPVIARVHAVAAAAGCQLVATCDLAVAAESARFAVNGVNIGLFCSTPMVALTRVRDQVFEEELRPGPAIKLAGPVGQFLILHGLEEPAAAEGEVDHDADAAVGGERKDAVSRGAAVERVIHHNEVELLGFHDAVQLGVLVIGRDGNTEIADASLLLQIAQGG